MSTRPDSLAIRLAVTAAGAVLLAASCGTADRSSGGPTDPAEAADAALDVEAGQQSVEDSDITGTSPTIDAAEPDRAESSSPPDTGTPINQYLLTIDQCFDRTEELVSGRTNVTTTSVPCERPHSFQIFGQLQYPAPSNSLYPGDDVMEDFALQSCYLQFEDWVGAPYETSELDIGVLTPDRTNFEAELASYRGIHCWVERVDGEPLVGTARDSKL